jgi:hypothetical protein
MDFSKKFCRSGGLNRGYGAKLAEKEEVRSVRESYENFNV